MSTLDKITERIGRWAAWLNVPLILLICYDVFMRYTFDETSVWILELEWHVYALIFLFGSALALKYDRHVRVDVFYDNFSDRNKALVNLTGILLFLLPWIVLVIWQSTIYAVNSVSILEGSPDPGGLPARYILKLCIPLSFLLLGLQTVSELLKSIRILSRSHPSNTEHKLNGPEGEGL